MADPKDQKRVLLNVSGLLYETFEGTLRRFPETLLGSTEKRGHYFCYRTKQYFFNRSRTSFEQILYFYQSNGLLTCPPDVDVDTFETECRFFELPSGVINTMLKNETILIEEVDDKTTPKKMSCQSRFWNFLDDPTSSRFAWWFGIFSLVMVCLSLLAASFETIPEPTWTWKSQLNLPLVDFVLNIWFLAELALRFQFSPHKSNFFSLPMTWIDILAVTPYFVLIKFDGKVNGLLNVFNTLKIIKVIRLFRFTKQACPLKIVGETLKVNMQRMNFLLANLVIFIVVGGTIMYVTESAMTSCSDITSIPQGLWWSVQTISKVGYGDVVPLSYFSKLLAGGFMVIAIITYLPLLSIASDFMTIYPKNIKYQHSQKERRKERKY